MKRLAALLGIGLLAACGQSGSNVSEIDNSLNVLDGDIPMVNAAAANLSAVDNGSANVSEPGQVIVGGLPLRLGFYVASKTDCAEATNSTLTLLRRDGYSGSRYSCTFGMIEKVGPTSYRVTETCTDAPGFGTREEPQTSVRTYDVPDGETFSAKSDSGWGNEARFCAQSSLPDPWRTNDISDIVGVVAAKN